VGTSFVVETGDPKHPFLAHTPTMRVPMPIAHTDYVYLAMRAALLAVHQHNQTQTQKINVLACPTLGTTTGQVSASEAARQMALAYQSILCPPTYLDWERATEVQQKVIFGGDRGMHLEL
jgi:O-acetyl-ADP-ribose deacetylase (regulator of RNase III)